MIDPGMSQDKVGEYFGRHSFEHTVSLFQQITLYVSAASQWANVPLLALREKGIPREDYESREIDIGV